MRYYHRRLTHHTGTQMTPPFFLTWRLFDYPFSAVDLRLFCSAHPKSWLERGRNRNLEECPNLGNKGSHRGCKLGPPLRRPPLSNSSSHAAGLDPLRYSFRR